VKLLDSRSPTHGIFARPELAEGYLNASDLKLSSARGLFACWRMGKTELLQQDLLPAARERGYIVAYRNLWDNRAAPEAALVSALSDVLAPQGVTGVLARLGQPVQGQGGVKIPGAVHGPWIQ